MVWDLRPVSSVFLARVGCGRGPEAQVLVENLSSRDTPRLKNAVLKKDGP